MKVVQTITLMIIPVIILPPRSKFAGTIIQVTERKAMPEKIAIVCQNPYFL